MIVNLAGLEVLIGAAVSLETNARADARLQKASRVLVVDGEAHVRAMIGATLESQGYQVQVTSCGREALKMVKENDFDLVLTEVVIQDGSGIALMELIREQQPQLPVVMVTAIHDISVAIDAMHRGAYDYVLKPFERDRLLGTVQHALEYRQTLQENHSYQQNLEMAVRARTELLRQAMEDIEQSYDITLEAGAFHRGGTALPAARDRAVPARAHHHGRPELRFLPGSRRGFGQAGAGTNTLIVASSDLSHYHTYDEAVKLDHKTLKAIEEYDYFDLSRNLERGFGRRAAEGRSWPP